VLFVGISSAVTVSHPLTFGYVRENPGPVARGDARGCNEHTANLDAPTRNLQNIKHKHADQHAKTRHTLSHPRVASVEPPRLATTHFQNCMYVQFVLCTVKERCV